MDTTNVGGMNHMTRTQRGLLVLLLTKEEHNYDYSDQKGKQYSAVFRATGGGLFFWKSMKLTRDRPPMQHHRSLEFFSALQPGFMYYIECDIRTRDVSMISESQTPNGIASRMANMLYNTMCNTARTLLHIPFDSMSNEDKMVLNRRITGMNQEMAMAYKLVEQETLPTEQLTTFPLYSMFPYWTSPGPESQSLVDVSDYPEFDVNHLVVYKGNTATGVAGTGYSLHHDHHATLTRRTEPSRPQTQPDEDDAWFPNVPSQPQQRVGTQNTTSTQPQRGTVDYLWTHLHPASVSSATPVVANASPQTPDISTLNLRQ